MLSRMVSGVSPGWMTRAAMPSVQAEAETSSAVDLHVAVEPAAGGELVLDQPVGGRGVGHAQQRLGQHHERQPFLGRQRIGVQKILDAAETAGLGADGFDQSRWRAHRCGASAARSRAASASRTRRKSVVRRRERRVKRRQPGQGRVHGGNLPCPRASPRGGMRKAREIFVRRSFGCDGAGSPSASALSLARPSSNMTTAHLVAIHEQAHHFRHVGLAALHAPR